MAEDAKRNEGMSLSEMESTLIFHEPVSVSSALIKLFGRLNHATLNSTIVSRFNGNPFPRRNLRKVLDDKVGERK